MEAKITIKFKKINGILVNEKLLDGVVGTKLFESTKRTVKILSKQIKKYFEDNKIRVITDFEIEK